MATKADIHEISVDIAGFFHKTWEKMDETDERVTIIEDHFDMPHQEENSSHFQKEMLRFLTSYAGQRLFCPTYFEELSESRSDGLAKHHLSDVFRSGSKKNTPNMNVLLLYKHTPKKSLSEVLLFSGY